MPNKKQKKSKGERNETQLVSQLLKTISRKHALLIGQRRQDLEQVQFYYCNSDSHSPRSFQSTSPVEFYRTSGAGLWQDAEGLGLPLISVLATGSSSLTEGSSLQTVMAEGFCSKVYREGCFLLLPKRQKAHFRYLVWRPCDFTESQE